MKPLVPPNQYDRLASAYVATVQNSPANQDLERPLTLQLLGDVAGCDVLDAGCGSGPLAAELLDRGARVVALDSSPAMLSRARARLGDRASVVQHDLNQPLPFPDSSFDAVAASFVLHYLSDWRSVAAELYRILRPGGRMVCSTHHPLRDLPLGAAGYLRTEVVTEAWDLDGEPVNVTFWRRPLQAMITAFTAAGFVVDHLLEPGDDATGRDPRLLMFRLRRTSLQGFDGDEAPAAATVPPHVVPGQSLCVELHVPSPREASRWFARWGFTTVRRTPAFVVLQRGGQLLLLGKRPTSRPATTEGTVGELRVLVEDVDAWRHIATEHELVLDVQDAYYGLREFVVATPFGIDLRVATPLEMTS